MKENKNEYFIRSLSAQDLLAELQCLAMLHEFYSNKIFLVFDPNSFDQNKMYIKKTSEIECKINQINDFLINKTNE